MEIGVGQLKLKIVGKEFYCRHCRTLTPKCYRLNHRSGIWFLVKATCNGNSAHFVTGHGEREGRFPFNLDKSIGEELRRGMSGCVDYEHGYVTCGGWYSIKSPVFVEDEIEEKKRLRLNDTEYSALSQCLERDKVKILTGLLDKNIISLNTRLGLWETAKPLLHTYQNAVITALPLDARITRIGDSFRAEFEYGNIKFNITKKSRYYTRQWSNGIVNVEINPRKMIYYGEVFGRKLAYYYVQQLDRIYAYEQRDSSVSSAVIYPVMDSIPKFMWWLFHRRLGDLIFVEQDDKDSKYLTQPLYHDQPLEKLQVISGTLEKQDHQYILKSDSKVVLYHPDHGTLELPANVYRIYLVPYRQRAE